MDDSEFKLFVERVKQRVAVEDVVRERVPDLKRAGALWQACCPFHDERTPSFKVDPRRGTWRCYGACGEGGDALSFLMRFDGASFIETLEQLAQVAGLEMPRLSRRTRGGDARQELRYATVERAAKLYQRFLHGEQGRPALDYLEARGLERNTVEAFGLGWAPAQGNPLLERATRSGVEPALLAELGLVRGLDEGRAYDFFHGRLLIPIRDRTGRPVGFGGRRLEDGEAARGPKYVNTPETPLFHKGRLIYGLDLALAGVRRTRELVLMEGYTDVMAAHQAGFDHTAAVLGTATTDDHAALVRRSGARRVVLLFDGDEAGRRATERALFGLLPLDLELAVASPPPGTDPCDMLVGQGAEPFRELLAGATPWFEFILAGLAGLPARELASAVDGVLRLVDRLAQPVHREALVRELAAGLELSEESVRLQWQGLRRGRPREGRPTGGFTPSGSPESSPAEANSPGIASPGFESPPRIPLAPCERSAYEELLGATLLDNGLIAIHETRLRLLAQGTAQAGPADPDPAHLGRPAAVPAGLEPLAAIAGALLELYENTNRDIGADELLTALGADPARELVVGFETRAEKYCQDGSTPLGLARGAEERLVRTEDERTIAEHRRLFEAGDETQKLRALEVILQVQKRLKVPVRD